MFTLFFHNNTHIIIAKITFFHYASKHFWKIATLLVKSYHKGAKISK